MLDGKCRMELIYRLTRQDHQQFCRLALKRAASHSKGLLGWKAATIVAPLASMVLTLFVLDYLFRQYVIDDRAFAAAALAYLWGLITMRLCGWFWRRQFWTNWLPDDSASLSEVRLKLDGDGVEGSDQTKVTKYSWRAFSDVSEHDNFIILWFDRAQGILVPARALANNDVRRQFVSLARRQLAPA